MTQTDPHDPVAQYFALIGADWQARSFVLPPSDLDPDDLTLDALALPAIDLDAADADALPLDEVEMDALALNQTKALTAT